MVSQPDGYLSDEQDARALLNVVWVLEFSLKLRKGPGFSDDVPGGYGHNKVL